MALPRWLRRSAAFCGLARAAPRPRARNCARSDTKLPLPTRRRMKPPHAPAVGRLHRVARHAQRPGQRARGGQGAAGLQRAVQDQLAHGPVDARVQRQGAGRGRRPRLLTDSSCACLNTIGLDLCEKWWGTAGHSRTINPDIDSCRLRRLQEPIRHRLPSVRIPRSLERSRPPVVAGLISSSSTTAAPSSWCSRPPTAGLSPELTASWVWSVSIGVGVTGLILSCARAHHHRLDPGRRLPGDGAGHHAPRRGGGRLPGVAAAFVLLGLSGWFERVIRLIAGRGRRAAGRHPAAVRHPGFWRRERGSGAGRPVDDGAGHHALRRGGGRLPGVGCGLCCWAALAGLLIAAYVILKRVTARYAWLASWRWAWPSCCCSSAST